jgi:hypothetical protein
MGHQCRASCRAPRMIRCACARMIRCACARGERAAPPASGCGGVVSHARDSQPRVLRYSGWSAGWPGSHVHGSFGGHWPGQGKCGSERDRTRHEDLRNVGAVSRPARVPDIAMAGYAQRHSIATGNVHQARGRTPYVTQRGPCRTAHTRRTTRCVRARALQRAARNVCLAWQAACSGHVRAYALRAARDTLESNQLLPRREAGGREASRHTASSPRRTAHTLHATNEWGSQL